MLVVKSWSVWCVCLCRWWMLFCTVLIKKGSKRKALSTSFHHFQGWPSDLATAVIPFLYSLSLSLSLLIIIHLHIHPPLTDCDNIYRMPNISYSLKTKRLAVGARSGKKNLPSLSAAACTAIAQWLLNLFSLTKGQVGIYDLKQSRVQMLNAHSHSVTVLVFSDDGKMLATYAYGDSKVIVWQVSIIIERAILGYNRFQEQIHWYLWDLFWGAYSSSHPWSGFSLALPLEYCSCLISLSWVWITSNKNSD